MRGPGPRFLRRLRKENFKVLCSRLEEKRIKGAYLIDPSNIAYLTGFKGPASLEVDCSADRPFLYVPLLEYYRAHDDESIFAEVIPYGNDVRYFISHITESDRTKYLQKTLKELVSSCREKEFAIEASKTSHFQSSLECENVEPLLEEQRSVKTAYEIELYQIAVKITEEIFLKAIQGIIDGKFSTVGEVWEFLVESSYIQGEGPSFTPIVATEKASFYPHPPVLLDGKLEQASLILIDYGIYYGGYATDMTRTLLLKSDGRIRSTMELLDNALASSVEIINHGIPAWLPDSVARYTLASLGLDRYFIHSLGHGVGVDVHEAPRISWTSRDIFKIGNLVTVEPGVYIKDAYGVRIENMVLVEKGSARTLNKIETIFV